MENTLAARKIDAFGRMDETGKAIVELVEQLPLEEAVAQAQDLGAQDVLPIRDYLVYGTFEREMPELLAAYRSNYASIRHTEDCTLEKFLLDYDGSGTLVKDKGTYSIHLVNMIDALANEMRDYSPDVDIGMFVGMEGFERIGVEGVFAKNHVLLYP